MSNSPVKYPERIEIVPLTKPLAATVRVPGSKSITNRALVLAALATCFNDRIPSLLSTLLGLNDRNPSFLRGVLESEDTQVMMDCLRALGFSVVLAKPAGLTAYDRLYMIERVSRGDEPIPVNSADLFVGNSGTTMRFLTALVALGKGRFRLDGVPRMRERPIADLLDALRQLGVKVYSERGDDRPPVIVEANGLPAGRVRIRGGLSSQFLSGLLMAAPLAADEITIEVDGPLVSVPYVSMTISMMRQFGANLSVEGNRCYAIPGRQKYKQNQDYQIEADASAASYWWGLAAIIRGSVTVPLFNSQNLQGDVRFVEVLERMGCRATRESTILTVHGGPLSGIDVDMNDISDTVMTLGAVALFADGPTTIRNVAHIRHKETDRLAALAAELRRVGAEVEEFADGLRITPRPLHGAEIETYNDHRMAMSMALVGLKVPGIVIKDPGCVAKTYPNFFSDLEKLRDRTSSC